MAVVGTAFIAIRPTGEGQFEAELVKDVKSAAAAAEKGAVITPVANTSKATGPLDLLKSKLTGFTGSGSPVTKALGDITTASGGAEGALAGVATGGLAIAGAAAVAFAAKSVSAFQEYAGAARGIQRVTGASATEASQLADAFRQVGIAPDQAAPALGRFARNLATNGEALGKLGVEVTKNKDGTTDMAASFINVADAVQSAKDPTQQLNIAMTAFGRGGQALLPILQKGREGIKGMFDETEKHGAMFSQKDLDTSKELTMAWRDVRETAKAVFLEVGKLIAPFVVDIVHIIQGVQELATKFTVVKDIIKVALEVAFAPLILIVKSVDLLAKAVDILTGKHREHKSAADADGAATADLGDETDQLAGAQEAAAKATAAATKAADDQKNHIKDLQSAVTGVTAAQKGLVDANKAVGEAQTKAGEAQTKLNALVKAGTVDTVALASAKKDQKSAEDAVVAAQEKVAASMRSVESARDAQIAALDTQATAQDRVNRLISGQAAAEDMLAHRHDLEHSQIAVTNATLRQHAAQAALATAQGDASTSADDLLAAQTNLEESNLSLTEAQENLVDTQSNLNDIQNEGLPGSKALTQATKDLDTANANVTTTTQGLMSAYRDQVIAENDLVTAGQAVIEKTDLVNKAMQPDPKLIADIKQATKDAKDGWDGVKDAQAGASEKAADLATKQGELKSIVHDSIPDLMTVKNNLQDIIALQPQATQFLQPTLDQINSLINGIMATAKASIIGWKPLPAGIAGPPTPVTTADFTPLPSGIAGPPSPIRHAAGGYDTGSFIAGENGAELVSLRPGGGAMVYAAGSPESRGGDSAAITITMENHFGPGTNAQDVVNALRSVAQNEMSSVLRQVMASAGAGRRR